MKGLSCSIVMLGAAALVACGQTATLSEGKAMTKTAAERSQDGSAVARQMGIALPASATVEYTNTEAGMDNSARLILLMPAADWAVMQAKPPFDTVPPDRYNVHQVIRLGTNDSEWKPRAEPNITAAQLRLPNAEYLNVGVAPAADGRVRVYLFWYNT